MQSGAFGPGEEPASWLPAADTSESLRRRALCGSVRAARAAKSRPGAGKELGEKPGSSARPRVNVPSDPILPLDQDGNGLGNGHLKNFHYSLIRVLRAIHRRAKRCLRKGKKGVRKPDGQQQSAAVSRSRWRAEHRAAAQGRAAPRPGRCAGGELRTDRPNGASPPRPAPRSARAAPRHSVPHRRPAPYRCAPSWAEPPAAGRSRGGAEPAGSPQRRDFLRGSPTRAPPGSSYALRGSRGAGAAPRSRRGALRRPAAHNGSGEVGNVIEKESGWRESSRQRFHRSGVGLLFVAFYKWITMRFASSRTHSWGLWRFRGILKA